VPDWDNTESRERDEDAAWRDLVARFDAPLTEQQPVPWPAREDVPAEPAPEADGAEGPDEARGSDGKHRGPEAGGLDAEPGRHAADGEHGRHAADGEHGRHAAGPDRGLHDPNGKHTPDGQGPDGQGPNGQGVGPGGISGAAERHGRLGADEAHDPEVIQVPRRIRGPVARGVPAGGTPAEDEEHFIPPAPPPLPFSICQNGPVRCLSPLPSSRRPRTTPGRSSCWCGPISTSRGGPATRRASTSRRQWATSRAPNRTGRSRHIP